MLFLATQSKQNGASGTLNFIVAHDLAITLLFLNTDDTGGIKVQICLISK